MKIYKLGLLAFITLFLFSCEKETEGLSRVTNFAVFEMKGADFLFVKINTSFSDPGVTATEDGKDLPVTTKGSVDTSTPGVYVLQYSAVNSDGLASAVSRTVAVVNDFPSVDLSGSYQIVSATRENKINVTKNGGVLGYYRASDSWYQAYAIPLNFLDMGDGTLVVLSGSSPYGGHYGTGLITADGLQFTVVLINQGPLTYTTAYFRI